MLIAFFQGPGIKQLLTSPTQSLCYVLGTVDVKASQGVYLLRNNGGLVVSEGERVELDGGRPPH